MLVTDLTGCVTNILHEPQESEKCHQHMREKQSAPFRKQYYINLSPPLSDSILAKLIGHESIYPTEDSKLLKIACQKVQTVFLFSVGDIFGENRLYLTKNNWKVVFSKTTVNKKTFLVGYISLIIRLNILVFLK